MLEILQYLKKILTNEIFISYLGIAIEAIFLFFVLKEFITEKLKKLSQSVKSRIDTTKKQIKIFTKSKLVNLKLSLVIIAVLLLIKFTPDWFYSFLGIEKNKESLMSFIELMIEAIFLFFVLKEFKMTRKSFELQEEELKNKYCHEVWHVVGHSFFHYLLFTNFSMGKGGGLEKYKNMIKEIKEKQPKERKKQLKEKINFILKIGTITNPEGEKVTENFKEVLNKYEHIVLKIVEELSMKLYYTLTTVSQNISDFDEVSIFKQEEQMMKQLLEHTFLSSTALGYNRAKWGDETILSLYKLLTNINVPKCNKN